MPGFRRSRASERKGSERQVIIGHGMHGHGLLVGHYLLGRALHDKIAAYAVIAHALKAQLAESHAYASGTKLLRDATANDLQHPRRGHEHAVLMF